MPTVSGSSSHLEGIIVGCPFDAGRAPCGAPLFARLTQVRTEVTLNECHEVDTYGPKTFERWEVWCERGHSITPRAFETGPDGSVKQL
jgi:hypothetical protein